MQGGKPSQKKRKVSNNGEVYWEKQDWWKTMAETIPLDEETHVLVYLPDHGRYPVFDKSVVFLLGPPWMSEKWKHSDGLIINKDESGPCDNTGYGDLSLLVSNPAGSPTTLAGHVCCRWYPIQQKREVKNGEWGHFKLNRAELETFLFQTPRARMWDEARTRCTVLTLKSIGCWIEDEDG